MTTAPKLAWCAARALAVLVVSAPLAAAQSVNFLNFTPSVIVPGTTTSVLVEAELGSAATSVTIDFNPAGTSTSEIRLRETLIST